MHRRWQFVIVWAVLALAAPRGLSWAESPPAPPPAGTSAGSPADAAVSASAPEPAAAAPVAVAPVAITVDPKLPLSALLQRAGAAFADSRYDEAIAYLTASYARQPAPAILFNIGQAHRKAGHTAEALQVYERFLRDNARSPLAPEAAAHADAMRAKLAAEQATVQKAEAEQLARERGEQAERAAELHQAERLQAEAALRKEVARKEQPVYKRKWFWGLLGGLVGAGVIAGVAVGLALRVPAEPAGSLATQEVHF